MFPLERVAEVQARLASAGVDGWLIYDFQKRNELAWEFLAIPAERHLTRRFFYWIPVRGDPVRIVHEIESQALDHLPGEKRVYLRWQTLEETLKEVLKGFKKVAMEYSPRAAIPYISRVDGGTVDLVRSAGVEVVSSAPFLQYYTSVLDRGQVESLVEAGTALDCNRF
jgi:Xaa-Pro dipeptidase